MSPSPTALSRPSEPTGTAAVSEEFIAMAAHELRGSATVIAGAAETLQAFLDPDGLAAPAGELLAMLARNARHMRKLAIDVLSSVYLEHGDLPVAMDTLPLLPIIGWAMEAIAPPHGSVRVECDRDLSATVDADHLEQILTNLLANALEHGAAPVVVSARSMTHCAGTQVAVRDCGQGVAAEDAAVLFDRFSPLAARTRTSTGLGLSISRDLARAMGGDLTYRHGDPGSTFLLTLRAA